MHFGRSKHQPLGFEGKRLSLRYLEALEQDNLDVAFIQLKSLLDPRYGHDIQIYSTVEHILSNNRAIHGKEEDRYKEVHAEENFHEKDFVENICEGDARDKGSRNSNPQDNSTNV